MTQRNVVKARAKRVGEKLGDYPNNAKYPTQCESSGSSRAPPLLLLGHFIFVLTIPFQCHAHHHGQDGGGEVFATRLAGSALALSLAASLEITVRPILLAVNESRVLRGEDYSRFLRAGAIQRTGEDAQPSGPEKRMPVSDGEREKER